MNALIGLEDKSQLALSSSGIDLPQPGQQARDPGPALLFDAGCVFRANVRFQTNVTAHSDGM